MFRSTTCVRRTNEKLQFSSDRDPVACNCDECKAPEKMLWLCAGRSGPELTSLILSKYGAFSSSMDQRTRESILLVKLIFQSDSCLLKMDTILQYHFLKICRFNDSCSAND
ncbi:hypothetical protein L6164_004365 [Bauhinia variegata]|uniref:Uncharacterized protein n=1 Tax=Bauhinia variegata TaxID=167791 RepID=A0ACB9Q4F8_BAUVA|nr:hypothetical protein L6164_004365 [Bauhinia variegata]